MSVTEEWPEFMSVEELRAADELAARRAPGV